MLLSNMLSDMKKASKLFQPTQFWARCVPDIIRDLEQLGIETFRTHPSALAYYVPGYGDLNYLADQEKFDAELERLASVNPNLASLWRARLTGQMEAEMDYRIFRAADPPRPPDLSQVGQSDFGAPRECYQFEGKSFDAAFLRYLKCLTFLKKHTPSHRIRNVLEIGGGYAVLGEILLKSPSRNYFYVNVDIPPTAYVASRYLSAVFGEAAVADYSKTSQMSSIDPTALQQDGFRAAVICPWQLPNLKGPFELFVNSASFQEMEPEVVANYAQHVTRLVSDFLLLKNSRHGKAVATDTEEIGVQQPTLREHYLQYFSNYELLAKDASTFGLQQGGFASEVMVFKRKKTLRLK